MAAVEPGDSALPVVAFVGGGASATLTAIALLSAAPPAGLRYRVLLIDEHGRHGRGVAYSTTDAGHLLNSPAAAMSALPDRPDHLLEWARRRDPATRPGSFVARRDYGAYLVQTLEDAGRTAPHAVVEHLTAQVSAVDPAPDGVAVHLADGGRLTAAAVVVATGAPAAGATPGCPPQLPGLVTDPWQPGAGMTMLGGLPRVLLVGTGLTMVDAALTLSDRSPGTVLHAVSRHGLLPRAHLPVPANNGTPAEPGGTALDLSPDRADGSLSLTELVRRVEQAAAADPGAWRSLVDSVRPHVQGLWSALTDAERQCFLADRARRWEVVRHRMAPEVAARLGDLLAQQRLQVHAGGLTAITPADDGSVRATLVDGTELAVDGVLDCTGGLATAAPLVRTLVAQGIASLDALALGLRTNEHGALLAADGAPQERLYTLGPLRRGELYETTAVPEIRAQAQALAARILEQLRAQLRR